MSPKKRKSIRKPRDHSDHYMRNIVAPEVAAANLRDRGIPIDAIRVRIGPNREGAGQFTLTCLDCGESGTTSVDPGNKVAVCPNCLRKGGVL